MKKQQWSSDSVSIVDIELPNSDVGDVDAIHFGD